MGELIKLDWDAGNLAKCQSHGVSIEEIESLFRGDPYFAPDAVHSIIEKRYFAIGRTQAGRALFVVFTFREAGEEEQMIRPISARYMHAKEAKRYGEEST